MWNWVNLGTEQGRDPGEVFIVLLITVLWDRQNLRGDNERMRVVISHFKNICVAERWLTAPFDFVEGLFVYCFVYWSYMFKDEDKFSISHFRIAQSLKNNAIVHSSLLGTLGFSCLSQYCEFSEEYRFQSCTAGVRVLFFFSEWRSCRKCCCM